MSELTTQLLDRLEKQLNQRQAELLREVDVEVRANNGEADWSVPATSDATILDDGIVDALVDLNLASIERHVHELRLIDKARDRLRDGSFGICGICGKPIGLARLLAVPYAEFCVACQRQAETPNRLPARKST